MDKSTNQIIHEWLGLGCWHEFPQDVRKCDSKCIHCGIAEDMSLGGWFIPRKVPDYSSSLDAVSVAEKKAVEVFGQLKCFAALEGAERAVLERRPRQWELITASASVRAEAVRKLIQESK